MKIAPIQVTVTDLTKKIPMMEMAAYSAMTEGYSPSINKKE